MLKGHSKPYFCIIRSTNTNIYVLRIKMKGIVKIRTCGGLTTVIRTILFYQ